MTGFVRAFLVLGNALGSTFAGELPLLLCITRRIAATTRMSVRKPIHVNTSTDCIYRLFSRAAQRQSRTSCLAAGAGSRSKKRGLVSPRFLRAARHNASGQRAK